MDALLTLIFLMKLIGSVILGGVTGLLVGLLLVTNIVGVNYETTGRYGTIAGAAIGGLAYLLF